MTKSWFDDSWDYALCSVWTRLSGREDELKAQKIMKEPMKQLSLTPKVVNLKKGFTKMSTITGCSKGMV